MTVRRKAGTLNSWPTCGASDSNRGYITPPTMNDRIRDAFRTARAHVVLERTPNEGRE
jgi:hypothetical protein